MNIIALGEEKRLIGPRGGPINAEGGQLLLAMDLAQLWKWKFFYELVAKKPLLSF